MVQEMPVTHIRNRAVMAAAAMLLAACSSDTKCPVVSVPLADVVEAVTEIRAELKPEDRCDATAWCAARYGDGVHCQLRTGRCVPDDTPENPWCLVDEDCIGVPDTVCHVWGADGGRCAPGCDSDDACVALSPNLLCELPTGLCYQAEPLLCATDAECGWMGPEYKCTSDNACKLLPPPELGCAGDEECPLEPAVTVCHLIAEAGVCAPPCESQSDCAGLGPDLQCDTYSGHCVAGLVCGEFKTLCGSGEACHQIPSGGVCAPTCAVDSYCASLSQNTMCDEASGACFYPTDPMHRLYLWLDGLPEPQPGLVYWVLAIRVEDEVGVPVTTLESIGANKWKAADGTKVGAPGDSAPAEFQVPGGITGADYIVLAEVDPLNMLFDESALRIVVPVSYFQGNTFEGPGQGFFTSAEDIFWPTMWGPEGAFGLATPTDNPPEMGATDMEWENEAQGLWLIDVGQQIGSVPDAGFDNMPHLNPLFAYEMWLMDESEGLGNEQFYSLGRFHHGNMPDFDGPGPNAGPFAAWNRPGSDFPIPGKVLADPGMRVMVTVEYSDVETLVPSPWVIFQRQLEDGMGHFFGGEAHGLENVAFEHLPRLEGWLEY